ncbi:zinc finger protein 865 [Dicentrarchus labrax]|uniref:zinc finger protein 865 n=1 Tax=Dicentrarchus labrax TaxID=13489 RepID=UPI0021F687E6|nr:zinc finger protein 865 [Dicentrarchus labrax]
MFQFSKYPMDILEMLSGHQAHQFKGLGLERQLSHQQQVQLQHQQQLQQQHQPPGDTSGSLLSGLGLGSLQSSRSNAFADSSSLFAKMSAPPPPISHQSQSSSSSHSSRKSSKMSSSSSSGSGSSSSGYPQFLRPFHPAEAALAQEQLHSGMGRFDFGGSSSGGSAGVIGGVVTPAPPPPPLHPGLSVPQPSPGPPTSSPSPSTSSASNNPSGSTAVPLVGQSDPRSLHQQFSCMLAANQYFLSGVPTNSSLEQFLVQQGTHNHLGLGLGQGAGESNSALAPPPALHSSHSHSHTAPQPQQQQQQLTPHALSHPHSHTHHPHPLHPAPQPAPLGGFDFQGIPVLSSNQIASLMQQEAGLPLPLPLHLSLSKDDGGKTGDSSSSSASSGGSRRKKAMAGYLPQRKADSSSHSHSSHSHNSSSSGHSQSSSSGLVGGGSGISGIGSEPQHSSLLSSSSQQSSSTVSSSSSAAPPSNSTSVLVANGNPQLSKSQESHSNSSSGQPEPEPLYHCGECGKTFTHLSSLRRHLRSHGLTPESQSRKSDCNSPSPERIFCCGECGKRFKKRGHLIQHSVTHSENRPFVCNICQKSFNRRESLTRHEKIHDEKPFRCPACGRCFRESTSLLNHAASGACGKPPRSSKNRAGAGGGGSSNPSSSKMGSSADRVGISGGAAMANDKYATDYSRSRYQSQSSYSGGVEDYRRSQSSTLYSAESTLASEMNSQTLRKAPLAPTLHPHPQSQQPQHHHHQPPQQPHLPLSSLLDDSEDEVTSSAMSAIAAAAAASCDLNTESREGERRDIIGGLLGGLGFGNLGGPSSTSNLNGSTMPLTHPSQPHSKPRRPRKPREKRDPSTIVRRRRSPAPAGDGSERPYSCHICGKRFRRAETLRRHNRVHTGEKPHACDVCGKMFREPFHLTKHLTVHSGQKNYKCNLCGKMFAYAQSLVRHGKLHRKGEIDNQGRRIKGAAAAAISQVANSANADYFTSCSQGEKSPTSGTPSQRLYTCTVCWKSFRHYFHLTAHQQTVHGGGVGLEKSFRCEVCGKAFAYSNSLVRHKLSQHGIDRSGHRVNQSQPSGYSPLFYDSGSGPNYAGSSHMQQAASGPQHQQQQQQQQAAWTDKKAQKKKRRVVIHSIMRDGKLVGVPLSKDTRRKLMILRKKRGKLQAQLNKKKLLAQLRIKGGVMKVKSWCGGAVRVTGLTSMDVPIKRFPCPICPSATYAKQGSLLVHHAIRHPPRNSGRHARLRCLVCGRRTSSLHKALKHRGQHLKQAAFQCRRCRHRFWNPILLGRHRFSCRGTAASSAKWALMKMKSPPSRDQSDSDQSPVQLPVPVLVQPERSTVLTEYSQ